MSTGLIYKTDPEWTAAFDRYVDGGDGKSADEKLVARKRAIDEMFRIELRYELAASGSEADAT